MRRGENEARAASEPQLPRAGTEHTHRFPHDEPSDGAFSKDRADPLAEPIDEGRFFVPLEDFSAEAFDLRFLTGEARDQIILGRVRGRGWAKGTPADKIALGRLHRENSPPENRADASVGEYKYRTLNIKFPRKTR